MTPRPSVAHHKQRPLSAIFIGSSSSTSTPPDLPRLPEPPSPGGSPDAADTGLPSPPATNSTGSGSVGDDTNTNTGTARNTGSLRKRTSTVTHRSSYSVSSASAVDMYDGDNNSRNSNSKNRNSRYSGHQDEDDDDYSYDNDTNEHDEDATARFDDGGRRRSYNPNPTAAADANEQHNSALQRVRSLTERNRMVLSKLSSIQRLSSPVPPKPARSPYSPPDLTSPSPAPHNGAPPRPFMPRDPSYASSSSSTSASASASSYVASRLYRSANNNQSGSETERETKNPSRAQSQSYVHHQHSSSDSTSNTPTSAAASDASSLLSASNHHPYAKQRRLSAPSSPGQDFRGLGKQRERDTSPPPTAGPSQARTPRKRASHAVTEVEREEYRRRYGGGEEPEGDDVMAAALAAVASSRNAESLGASAARGKRMPARDPLPAMFRQGDDEYVQPTPQRERAYMRTKRSTSPATQAGTASGSVNDRSPRRREASTTRTSTVRDLTRKHQTRWLSEDLTAPQRDDDDEPSTPSRSRTSTSNYGRRQLGRHGSMDNALSPSKRLVDEGLRAAGISVSVSRRREADEDVFANDHGGAGAPLAQTRRTRSTGARSIMSGEAEWDSPVSAYGGGLAGGLPRATPSSAAQRLSERQVQYSTPGSRPVSSMAALRHEALANVPPRTAPAASRAYRSTHNRDLSASTITLDDPVSLPPSAYTDRSFQTPASGRLSTAPTGGRESQAEHRRLMLEALGMFESQLSRLPPMGQTTTSTIPEVFQSSQQLVHTLDRLNSMIGASAGKALDAQIEAEIGDGADEHVDLKEIWQNVGCDQREHLRLSSEIVRNTTQLLLGVGKVLRDAVNANANAASHMRSVSLDEEAGRRFAASEQSASSDKRSSDGRQSRETRRSWDPRENLGSSALKERLANIGRSNASGSRPSSAMHSLTRGSAGSSEGTGDGGGGGEPQTSLSTRLASLALNPSTRRLYTPRDKRIVSDTSPRTAALMSSTTSQETVHAYEPSPTPATRQGFIQVMGERTRALPSLAIPSTLPTLPSESLITGQNSATNSYADNDGRRKVSTSSNMTVRAEGSSLPSMIKPPNATTAVTPTTVSNTPSSESPPSLSRTNSRSSTGTNGVTFSRPSTISISTLQQHANSHGHGFFHRAASMDSAPEGSNSPRDRRAGVDIERPKTIGSKGRASLDGVRANVTGSTTPSSTLQSIRKERRRTITEIFAQVNK